jgi:hypothetical protein
VLPEEFSSRDVQEQIWSGFSQEEMDAIQVYADGLPGSESGHTEIDGYAAALAWYERLLGRPPTFVASDTVTAFSILDTVDGVVRSYAFDTTRPDSEAVLFDEFTLG